MDMSPDSYASSLKLFIIDDSPSTLSVLCDFLHDEGYCDLVAFGNPIDALIALEEFCGTAIVISDYTMPDIDGLQLLNLLTANNPALNGIIITADPGSVPLNCRFPVIEKGCNLFSNLLLQFQTYTVQQRESVV